MDDRLLHLQGLLESRQWEPAWDEFQRLEGEGPPSARLLLMGSHAAYGRLDLFRARNLADNALAAKLPADQPRLLGQIRFHLGMVARKIGDNHVALEQFQLFLSEMPTYPELAMGEGKAYYYLGLTLGSQRESEAAVAAYCRAIEWFRGENMTELLGVSLHNLAWLFCQVGRADEARECLSEAANLLVTPEMRVHQTLGEAYLAVIDGNYRLAAQLGESIFRRLERGEPITPDEQSQAAWLIGTAALAQGHLSRASALAEVALSCATEAKESRLINDANSLRRSVYLQTQAGA